MSAWWDEAPLADQPRAASPSARQWWAEAPLADDAPLPRGRVTIGEVTPVLGDAPDVEYSAAGDYAGVFREPVEDASSFGKIGLRALVGRAPEILASAVELPATANEALTRALGMTPTDSGVFGRMRGALRTGAEAIRELGYEGDMDAAGYGVPSVSGADVVEAVNPAADVPLGERAARVGRFIPETLLASAPDMVATLTPASLAAYMGARTGEVAEARAQNDRRDQVGLGDLAVAAPAAAVEALLERFTTMRLMPQGTTMASPGVLPAMGRIARELGIQGSLGGLEELAPYLAETVGTEAGATGQGAVEALVGGILAEGALGAGVQGGREVVRGVRELGASEAPPASEAAAQTSAIDPALLAAGDAALAPEATLGDPSPAPAPAAPQAPPIPPEALAGALEALGDTEAATEILAELGAAPAAPQPPQEAAAALTPAPAPTAPTPGAAAAPPMDDDADLPSYSPLDLRAEIGWAERGGQLLRAAPDPETLNADEAAGLADASRQGDVVGRTPWVGHMAPDGSESTFWRNRPVKLTEAQARAALDKFERGEALSRREQDFVDYAAQTARSYAEAERETMRELRMYDQAEQARALAEIRAEVEADIADGDQAEALTVYELARRAAAAGADEVDVHQASNESDRAYAARLWSLIRSGTDGADTRATQEDRREGDPGREGRPVSVAEDDAYQQGLFPRATPREEVAGEARRRDAARDGRAGTARTDMAAGEGELFAGDRPLQGRIEEPRDDAFVRRGGAEYLTDQTGEPVDFTSEAEARRAADWIGGRIRQDDPVDGEPRTWSVIREDGHPFGRADAERLGVEASRDMFVTTRGDRAAQGDDGEAGRDRGTDARGDRNVASGTPGGTDRPGADGGLPEQADTAGRGPYQGRRDDYSPALGRRALNAVDELVRRNGGSVLADTLARDFRYTDTAQLIGQTVRSPQDLAALASVYRNPLFETLHYVFVDDAGRVVGESALSDRLPASSAAFPAEVIESGSVGHVALWLRKMAPPEATGLWLTHNHPSGIPRPSQADRRMTRALNEVLTTRNTGIRLHGHVVLNHNRFGSLTAEGANAEGTDIDGMSMLWTAAGPDPLRAQRGMDFLGDRIVSPEAAAKLGQRVHALTTDPDAVAVLVTDAQGSVVLATAFPVAALESRRGPAILTQLATRSGGFRVFAVASRHLATQERLTALRELTERNVLTDAVIVMGDGQAQSLQWYSGGAADQSTRARRNRAGAGARVFEDDTAYMPGNVAARDTSIPDPRPTPGGFTGDVRDLDRASPEPGLLARQGEDLRRQWDGLRQFFDGRPRNPESIGRRLNDLRAAVFSSIVSRARDLEARNPQAAALRDLFNLVMAAPGDDRLVLETVNDAIQSRFALFTNRARNILSNSGLGKMTPIENAQLRAYMLGTETDVPANIRTAGDALRKLMDVQREDMLAAGIEVGEVEDIGYLTRIYDDAKILDDPEGFTRAARELYERHEFALEVGATPSDIMYGEGTLARFLGYARRAGESDQQVQDALDEIKALLRSYRYSSNTHGEAGKIMAIVGGIQPRVAAYYGEMKAAAWLHGINTPDARQFGSALSPSGAPITRSRELSGAADTVMTAYLKTDMLDILDTYARTAARKVEHATRFGPDGSRIQDLLDRASAEGVPRQDLEQAMTLVDSVIGLRTQPVESKLKAAADFIHAWSYVALLGRATFSSLAEAVTFTIRTGNLVHAVAPLIQVQRALTRSKKGKALNELAQVIAVNGHKAVEDVIMNRLGGDYAMTPRWSQLLHRFFYATLLTPLTRAQRAYGVGAATGFLRSLARNVEAGKDRVDTAALLNEVGIADHQAFAEWMLAQGPLPDPRTLFDENGRPTPRGQDYMVAVRRIIDQTIQNPGAEHRPAWQNSMMGRVFTGIMSFSYAAYENIIRREAALMARNLRDEGRMKALQRNGVALAGAASLVLAQTITSTIRELLFNSARFEDKDEEEIAEEMVALGLSRTFGLGTADPLIQYLTGLKYQRGLAETMLGAGPGMFAKAADTWGNLVTGRNSDNTDTAEYNAAREVWKVALAPAFNILLSRVPLVGGPAIMVGSGADAAHEFAQQFARRPEARTKLDDRYQQAAAELEEVLDIVDSRIAALPKDQWAEELATLKDEYPSILAGVTLDVYADNAQNRRQGRVGEPKDNRGKPKLRLQGPEDKFGGATEGSVLGELEGYERYSPKAKRFVSGVGIQDEISALSKAIRNISRDEELTVGDVLAFTEGGRASDGEPIVIRPQFADDLQARLRQGEVTEQSRVSKRDANRLLEELQKMRRERKQRALDVIERGSSGARVDRGEGRPA